MFTFPVEGKDAVQLNVVLDVVGERYRQDKKWGDPGIKQTLDRRMTIITEEIGEVAEAILENNIEQVRLELVQVAAVAIATIEAIDKGVMNV